jgi:hypothetical protein
LADREDVRPRDDAKAIVDANVAPPRSSRASASDPRSRNSLCGQNAEGAEPDAGEKLGAVRHPNGNLSYVTNSPSARRR